MAQGNYPLHEQIKKLLDENIAALTCGLVGALNSRLAPIFTLSARGMGKPALCLCLGDIRCVHLASTGCSFSLEGRPFECAAIVPSTIECKMPSDIKMEDLWVPYQELLRTIIEEYAQRPWLEELEAQIYDPRRSDAFAKGAQNLINGRGLASDPADVTLIADMARSLPF
jgi:hypothetical protein